MAASPYDPLVRIEGLPSISGPASINAMLLDMVSSTPFEGIWVPWLFVKQGSLEVSGSMSTLSLQLYGTNLLYPVNSYTITCGGTANTGNVVQLNFTTPLGVFQAAFTDTTGNTTTQIAQGIVASINTNAVLASFGFQASNLANVVTVTWPSQVPTVVLPGYSTTTPSVLQVVTIATNVTGSATETLAVAAGTTGSAVGSAITSLGMTQFTLSARWLKVRLTTLTGGGANITAVAQGTA